MPNPVSSKLPVEIDERLAFIAQATGAIGYGGIEDLGNAWNTMPEDGKNAVASLLDRIYDACADSMLDPDESMREDGNVASMIAELAGIVKAAAQEQ